MPSLMHDPSDLSPSPAQAPADVRRTRIFAVVSLVALIALVLAWELWLAPLRPGGSWLALKALPLALPLPGLLRNRMYTYRWTSLFVWLYFTEGIVRASGDRPPGNLLAVVQVLLCLSLFAACVLHIRLRQKHARLANHPNTSSASKPE